jgi:hypothetical protein
MKPARTNGRTRLAVSVSVSVFCLLAFVPLAHAAAADDAFTLSITPYAWMPGVDGSVGIFGIKRDFDANFCDVVDDSDSLIGLFGRVEARYRRFGFYADGGFMRVGVNNVHGPLGVTNVDVTQKMGMVDFGLMYRVVEHHQDDSRFALDATVGGRYWTMTSEFNPTNVGLTLSSSEGWVDPTIGLRSTIGLARRWEVIVGGDVGGFNTVSEFTWSAIGTVGYVFDIGRVRSSVYVGYKAIGDEYSNDGFTFDAVLHGPVIGWGFTF